MKSKVRFPFVYFYLEPNRVYMYKMDSTEYLTVSNWTQNGEWRSFEIADEEAFETFKHEETQPPEGYSIFVNQDVLNDMVEEINNYIQQYRSLLACKPFSRDPFKEVDSVHIVSSESAAGTVRVGLQHPKTVIGFTEFLAIGPIWKLHEKKGQVYRNEWLFDHINSEQDEFEGENKFRNMLREIEDIPETLPIYIWYGNDASEQTFLRFILYILRHKANVIYLMNFVELYEKYITTKDAQYEFLYTSHLASQDVRVLFEKRGEVKALNEAELYQYHKEWETLSQAMGVLRIFRDNEIMEVKQNQYDSLILNTIKKLHDAQEQKDFIKTGSVIGEVLENRKEFKHADYLEYRIRDLIYTGFLELKGVPKSMSHYRVKLRS